MLKLKENQNRLYYYFYNVSFIKQNGIKSLSERFKKGPLIIETFIKFYEK